MVAVGEFKTRRIVAVHKNDQGLAVLSPCGRCREFIKQIYGENLDTEVILSPDRSVPLKELLPLHDWYCPVSLPNS